MTDTAPGNLNDMAALLRRFFAVREARIIEQAMNQLAKCERPVSCDTPKGWRDAPYDA